MGFFAALLTYLVAAALLVGGMVTAVALFFAKPADDGIVAEKPRPPLVRAADRQAAEAAKTTAAEKTKTAVPPQSANGVPTVSAVNRSPAASPQLKAAEPAKRLAGQPARKKKVAKPASAPSSPSPPREEEGATLGYSSSEPRKFVFPLDPDW
jgi:hypothetical protein